MRHTLRALLGLCLICLGGPFLRAANTHVLEIDNGERLLGELIGMVDDRVHFRSEMLGEIFVPAARAKVLPLAVEDAQGALQKPGWTRVAAPEPAPAKAPGPGKSAPASRPADTPARPWRYLIELGYGFQSSTVMKSDAYLRGEVVRASDEYSYKIYGKYLYGQQEHVRNVDKVETGFNAQHELAGRWHLRNDLAYQNDRLRLLDVEVTEVVGLSYEIFKLPQLQFSAGPGVGVRYREPEIGHTGYTVSTDFSDELTWKLTDRIKLGHIGSFLADPRHPSNYRLRSAAVATGRISDQLSVNLRYEYEFDHARPVVVERVDQRVFTTLGYSF